VILIQKLNRPAAKLAVLLPVLLLGAVTLSIIRTHFVVRQLSDVRFTFEPGVFAAALRTWPRSPRLNLGMAKALIRERSDFAAALAYAELATKLAPYSDTAWQVLGQAQDGIGEATAAEKSLQRAVELAPRNSDANWALANLLVRLNQVEESIPMFSKAGELNASLYPLAFDLLWQVGGKNLDQLRAVAGARFEAQIALLQFFAEQDLFDEAAKLFKTLDRRKAKQDPQCSQFINTLIGRKQFTLARATWLDLVESPVEGPAQNDGNLLWNGGFELPPVLRSLNQFDWFLGESKFARFGFEAERGRTGPRALKVVFQGRDTTLLNGETFQLVAVTPGVQYHLECYAKAENLVTPEGPRLAVRNAGTVLATSEPVEPSSKDWQRLQLQFTAPLDNAGVNITLVRLPKYAYDDPTSGVIWFDDFMLRAR
jgi:tetratricopeptide (TPR) repeat protein